MTFRQRLVAYDWSKELIILGFIILYICLHYAGVGFNNSKVSSWIKAHREVLFSQFYQVGCVPNKDGQKDFDLVVSDSPTSFTTYATGRVNINSLTGQFELLGRQNFITLAMDYGFDFFFSGKTPKDKIELTIVPSDPSAIEPFVFAVVNKSNMRTAREDNYFLSLTRTSDSAKLPPTFTFMSEGAEINETLYSKELAEAIDGSDKVLEYLAVTDLPGPAPALLDDLKPSPKIVLSLKFPRNEEQAKASARVLNAAINLVDVLVAKKAWRPEIVKKIRATREAEVKKALKSLDIQKQEKLAQKKAEVKREQEANLAKLSPAEQRKAEQKERERELRRQKNKNTKRM